ncbi:MAG: cell division protein FtsA [Patescibacteria group bacterium]|jgi:cell division protein FtsA
MAREEIITGLDIGSSMVRVAMGQLDVNGRGIQILGVAEAPADGLNKGSVTSIEDAVSSVSSALEAVERMTGIPVEHAYLGIGGTHISAQESHGVVAVSKADGEIKEEDIERVVEAAQAVATPPNYEILHVLPRSFTVDNQKGIKDPVGMTGIRLEVDAQIIQGLSAQVKNITKCVYRTGVDISDVVVGVLAASESVLTKRQKDLGVALVNLGGATTSVLVFEEGDVLHAAILPIGAAHITNDIAIGLRTSIDIAERIKLEYGTALVNDVPKREEIRLEEFSEQENGVVERKHVAEIIEARCEEIFKMVEKELVKVDRSGLLPAGIVLTGGGAKLPGLVEIAKREFRLPAFVGYPQNIAQTPVDKINDPSWSTAVGLVVWGASLATKQGGGLTMPRFSSVADVTGKMRKWFKSLIP